MKFAKFWAFTLVPAKYDIFGLNTVKLWGASNESMAAAAAHAQSRAARLRGFFQGDQVARQDYEYWMGFIREEVLEEITSDHGRVLGVITRNHYGAEILNSTSVLFGDIDVTSSAPGLLRRCIARLGFRVKDKAFYLHQLEQYQRLHPQLNISIFETCAGLRFVITNQALSPDEPFSQQLFNELGVDKLYQRLCLRQNCFRARLTPKPWRMHMERPASRFPRNPEVEQPEFEHWLAAYQQQCVNYGVARQIHQLGNQSIPADIKKILAAHSRCVSSDPRPLA